MFPDPWRSEWHRYHPILEHLAHELEAQGCRVVGTPDYPTLAWMYRARRQVDLLHLHWPEGFYQTGSKYRIGIGLARLLRFLAQVRVYGYRLVWTIHEVYPHSIHYSRYPIWAHRYARRLICRNADALTVNCETARSLVEREFAPTKNVTVVELGNYLGFYPDNVERQDARAQLGLTEENVAFLVFGTMRPNRNPADVIRAFRRLNESRARLFVIGQSHGVLRDEVEQAAWGDWRIRVYPYVVDNDAVSAYFRGCDVVVMPGRDYTTSAVIMLGLSYGKPIICSPSGCARDMVGGAGLYYDSEQPDDLQRTMQQAMQCDLEELGILAKHRTQQFTWQQSAEKLARIYRSILR